MEIKLTNDNFKETVMNSEKLVLIDFWAAWCGPCRMIAPIIEEIAEERKDILVCKVNVDEEEALAAQFGISSIPTIVVMKNGKITAKAKPYRFGQNIPVPERTLFCPRRIVSRCRAFVARRSLSLAFPSQHTLLI